eukprot:scaffold4547_cov103-Cylindrotheca_fusiformis.AAC.3
MGGICSFSLFAYHPFAVQKRFNRVLSLAGEKGSGQTTENLSTILNNLVTLELGETSKSGCKRCMKRS